MKQSFCVRKCGDRVRQASIQARIRIWYRLRPTRTLPPTPLKSVRALGPPMVSAPPGIRFRNALLHSVPRQLVSPTGAISSLTADIKHPLAPVPYQDPPLLCLYKHQLWTVQVLAIPAATYNKQRRMTLLETPINLCGCYSIRNIACEFCISQHAAIMLCENCQCDRPFMRNVSKFYLNFT